MFPHTLFGIRRATAVLVSALTLPCLQVFAGAQATADKDVSKQQVEMDQGFPLHFSLSVGGDNEFVFRGVDILPEVDVNVRKALTQAINAVPAFRSFLLANGVTPKQFVALTTAPVQPVKIARESGIYYVDGNVSATLFKTNFQLGAFYATQAEGRIDHTFFGSKPNFTEYHEFDAYLNASRSFGPIRVSLGGTFYHVVDNSDFDTAELNFGVTYTPPQFPYVSASFSYNYASAFNFSDYVDAAGANVGEYLDGHYLEARIDGNIPLYKHVITFNPYVLVSAGSGILPRAFNLTNLPTYSNTERYGQGSVPYVNAIYQAIVNKTPVPTDAIASGVASAFDPRTLDRSFDLSNFQAGFRVPFYLTRHITIRGDFNYSRPLGNLDREPYNQKDQIWGGGTMTFTF